MTGRSRWNQFSNQHPRDRGVSIGKMKFVRLFGGRKSHRRIAHARMRSRLELQPLKSRLEEHPTIERRDRVDSHTEKSMRPSLVKRNYVGMHVDYVEQIVFI